MKNKRNNQELIEKALSTRIYLLETIGPTSFKFCDENNNKYKVHIGDVISCTCSQKQTHCIHTLHALIKVLKVDQNSPILQQHAYSQYDINNILNGKYSQVVQKPKAVIKSQQQQQQPQEPNEDSNRMEIDQDSLCPICQESLTNNEALTFCKKQCGNNFHAKCMMVWVQQKKASGKQEIACPMCRCDWGQGAHVEIRLEEKLFEQQNKTHKKTCQGCRSNPIIGGVYRCVTCPNYHFCEKCHKNVVHPHAFMFKLLNTDPFQIPNLDSQIPYYQNGVQGQQLMLVGMTMNKPNQGCSYCGKKDNLKLLPCGHIVDFACLSKLSKVSYVCPIDSQPVFPGLFNTLTAAQKENISTQLNQLKRVEQQQVQQLDQQRMSLPPIKKQSVNKIQRQQSKPRQLSANRQIGFDLQIQQIKRSGVTKYDQVL